MVNPVPFKTPAAKITGKTGTQRLWNQNPDTAAIPVDSGHIATFPFSMFNPLLY